MAVIGIVLGANLNMLGKRNPVHYGSLSLDEIMTRVRQRATELQLEVRVQQSNIEGELVNWVHANRDDIQGYVVNPGGFTMFGQSLRDAIVDTGRPFIEVHMSNIHTRHIRSIWSEDAWGQVSGFHWRGYLAAIDLLHGRLSETP